MLEYQKSSPTHPILTQLRTAVMVVGNFTRTLSLTAQRSPPKKPRQINVALTLIKTSQLEEHLEDM
jgi:hypothetical protein